MSTFLIILSIFLLIPLLYLGSGIRVVQEYERCVIFRLEETCGER